MPVNDVFEVRFHNQWGFQAGINIRHYKLMTITGTEFTMAQRATAVANLYQSLYKALMTDQAEFRLVAIKRVLPIPVTADVLDESFRGPGTRTGDPLPPQVSGLISLRSGIAGRKNRGRLYVPFPAETDSNTVGRPGTTYLTNLAALAVQFFGTITLVSGLNIETWQNVIKGRTATQTVNIIEARSIPRWATQRRRGDLGRPNIPV